MWWKRVQSGAKGSSGCYICRLLFSLQSQNAFLLPPDSKHISMHKLLFIIAFVLASYGITRAQDFSYTVTTDSVSWNDLNAQTILNSNNSAWNFSYRVPIGFTFPFLGREFDSLTVETNGYIVFDNERNYALTAFSGVGDHVDSSGNHALIGYELSGTTGNHVLKMQYTNCSPSFSGDEVQSWQVWLKENGNIEFRIGPGTLRSNVVSVTEVNEISQVDTTYSVVEIDTTQMFRIGLLNMNMNGEENGLFIAQSPTEPQIQVVNAAQPETGFLVFVPAPGYRYAFSPSN